MTNVKSIRIGDKDVYLVMKGGQAVWPERANLVGQFIDNVIADGYTVDEAELYKSWQSLHPLLKRDFSEALILGAYKQGSIAAMKSDGSIVNYPFTRNSTKTYWDKDGKMKLAAVNVPTIDYDPVTRECKGYGFNRALTNLWTESTMNNMGLTIKNTDFELGDLLNTGSYFKRYNGVSPILDRSLVSKASLEVGKTYTLLFYIKRSDNGTPQFRTSDTGSITIRIGNVYVSTPSNNYEQKLIDNGVYRIRFVFTSANSSSTVQRYADENSGDYDYYITGYNIFQGDVSIDEPYVPTNGSIVTTVADAAPRSDNTFNPYDKAVFYGDIDTLYSGVNLGVIGADAFNYASVSLLTSRRVATNLSGSISRITSAMDVIPVPPSIISIKLLSQKDAINSISKMFLKGAIYQQTPISTGGVQNTTFYIPACNNNIPFKYIKCLVAILDKNVTDEEGLKITS